MKRTKIAWAGALLLAAGCGSTIGIKTGQEWAGVLTGKSMLEVKELLGPPDFAYENRWIYKEAVIHPVTEKPDRLSVIFLKTGPGLYDGTVDSVQAGSSGGPKWEAR